MITNDYESAFSAVQHLIEHGCNRIAYLVALNQLSTGKNRFAGYCDALTKYVIPYNQDLVVAADLDEGENYKMIDALLKYQKPDAVICSIEHLTLACYYSARNFGINIPEDLKIIGFSNLNTASLLSPPLTTITQPAFEIGSRAASILFKILKNSYNELNETVVIKSTLIERESTALFK